MTQAIKRKERLIERFLKENFNRSTKNNLKFPDNGDYLIAINSRNEGIFLISEQDLIKDFLRRDFLKVIAEAKAHNLKRKYHIFALTSLYNSEDINFTKVDELGSPYYN